MLENLPGEEPRLLNKDDASQIGVRAVRGFNGGTGKLTVSKEARPELGKSEIWEVLSVCLRVAIVKEGAERVALALSW